VLCLTYQKENMKAFSASHKLGGFSYGFPWLLSSDAVTLPSEMDSSLGAA
jgi:hypothetical protein